MPKNLTRVIYQSGPRYLSAIILSIFSLLPLMWGLTTSFKHEADIFALPPQWIPKAVTLVNYLDVVKDPVIPRYFLNTVIISAGTTGLSLIVAVLAAYGFSRFRFYGKETIFLLILFTRILPRVTLIIPFFITLKWLHLLNTYPGLILVYMMVVMPLSVWLLRGFFDNVPYEVEEAAIIDGCNHIQLLTKIVIPMSLPSIAAVGMYAFIMSWNEFLFALIVSTDASTRPISIGLAFFIDESGIHWGSLMAASVLMSVSVMVLFSFALKYLVKGLTEGALKG